MPLSKGKAVGVGEKGGAEGAGVGGDEGAGVGAGEVVGETDHDCLQASGLARHSTVGGKVYGVGLLDGGAEGKSEGRCDGMGVG
jgi:hypothetical protein